MIRPQIESNTEPRHRVLVVGTPELRSYLAEGPYETTWTENPSEMLGLIRQLDFDLAMLDIDIDSGLALCNQVTAARPETPVVVVTADRQLDTAVGAIRAGAYDFVSKPLVPESLERTLERALRHRDLRARLKQLSAAAVDSGALEEMIGASPEMRSLFRTLAKVAATDTTVLVTGESGTGKERIATAIHKRSQRAERPFVGINCGAVAPSLLESELFGHVKGAFTSARASRRGLFLAADGGTVLLDEIGEMPLEMQAKLLRVLQERTVRPVGGDSETPFDARVIAATNRDLAAEVREGRFREDLYYRINVVQIEVPPLRARGGDILLLANHFVEAASARLGRAQLGISQECARRLLHYDWPGNVRELENAIEHAVALCTSDELKSSDLPAAISNHRRSGKIEVGTSDDQLWMLPTLSEVECNYIHHVLDSVGGNKTRAAEILGLDRRTLYRRLAKFEPSSDQTTRQRAAS